MVKDSDGEKAGVGADVTAKRGRRYGEEQRRREGWCGSRRNSDARTTKSSLCCERVCV
jgi:hypothetical protein